MTDGLHLVKSYCKLINVLWFTLSERASKYMKQLNLRTLLIASMFTALMAIGARIQFPIPPYPVPMTLQTAFLYLCALLLPAKQAFYAQLTYLLLGLLGLPVFTSGGGIGYVLDPRFGYLLAFLVCAPLLSLLAKRTLYNGRKGLYAIGGFIIIFLLQLIGVFYMALLSALYLGTPMETGRLLYLLFIFLPLDAVKLFASTMLAAQLRRRLPGYFPNTSRASAM